MPSRTATAMTLRYFFGAQIIPRRASQNNAEQATCFQL